MGLGTFHTHSDSRLTADEKVVLEAPERAGHVLVDTGRLRPESPAVDRRSVIA